MEQSRDKDKKSVFHKQLHQRALNLVKLGNVEYTASPNSDICFGKSVL